MSWLPALVPFLVGLVLVFVPGLIVVSATRVRGFDALAIAPAISIASIAISAIVAPLLGINWAAWVPFAFAFLLAVLGFVVQTLFQRLSLDDAPGRRTLSTTIARTPMSWNFKSQIWFYVSAALGSLMTIRNLARSIGDPNWVSQTWDNTFHLNAVRYIVENSNGSSLFIASMTSGDGSSTFYPAAWHDLVSLAFSLSGVSIPVATSATVLLVGGVIWPLAVIYMVRSIFSAQPLALLITGVAAGSISAFPFSLVFFGVLYPNLLGYSILPIGIGMMAQLFRVGLVRYLKTSQAVFLGVFVALGIAISHPNSVMSLLVLVIPIFIARIVLQIITVVRREINPVIAIFQIFLVIFILIAIFFLWGIIRPLKEAGIWGPTATQGQALGELITNQTLETMRPLWVVTALSLIGISFLIKCRNRLYWIFGMWVLLAYFYVAVRAFDWSEGRYEIVGIWYSDPFRLAALTPVVVLPFIAYGVSYLDDLTRKKLLIYTKNSSKINIYNHCLKFSIFILTALLMQISTPLNNYIHRTRSLYEPTIESALLTPDEYDVLNNIDNYVSEDEEIIVSPFSGGSLAYALADRKVTAYHTLWTRTDDENYIYNNLDKADADPRVCQILDENNISYFLWFGWKEINNGDNNHAMWYTSFERLWDTEGIVEPVYRSGGATLYKITACQ